MSCLLQPFWHQCYRHLCPLPVSFPHVTCLNSINNIFPAAWRVLSLPFPQKEKFLFCCRKVRQQNQKSSSRVEGSVSMLADDRASKEGTAAAELGAGSQEDSRQRYTESSAYLCSLLCGSQLLFYQQIHFIRAASYFKRPYSASILVFKRGKQSGKNKLPLSLAHIFSLKHEDRFLKIHNQLDFLEREVCGMPLVPGMSLFQWSCQLSFTGQTNKQLQNVAFWTKLFI